MADTAEKKQNKQDRYIEELIERSKSTSKMTRFEVARDYKAPSDVLEMLSHDDDELVREAVARNPHTPPDVLQIMYEDKDINVVRGVLSNHGISQEKIREAYDTGRDELFISMSLNSNTPSDILNKLAHYEFKGENGEERSRNLKNFVAKNIKSPATTLRYIAGIKDDIGKYDFSLSSNCKTPSDILQKIYDRSAYEDPQGLILSNLAANSNVSPEILEDMVRRNHGIHDKSIKALVLKNPNISQEALKEISKNIRYAPLWKCVAANPKTSEQTLESLYQRSRKITYNLANELIYTIARNTNTPAEILKEIAVDNQIAKVRTAAKDSLNEKGYRLKTMLVPIDPREAIKRAKEQTREKREDKENILLRSDR